MSCWVVPAVAAEYWGVTLDVVWSRIYSDLVPHKTERGFVFIDVDPWHPEPDGSLLHQPPPTFVPAEADFEPACPEPACSEPAEPVERATSDTLVCEEDESLSQDYLCEDEELMLDGGDLPELDEEESATFGRLSWQEVRQTVSRTRRPPPKMQNSI